MFLRQIKKINSLPINRNLWFSKKNISILTNTETNPGKVVFISQSDNVYHNLAVEEWLYKNWDFRKRHLLYLWANSPCVVIGRHQNPYVEANLKYLESAHVPVVRRNSGGGTVYHDEGNLNCTFFTPRERYDRRWNLSLICEALYKDFGIDTQLNTRDDLITANGLKVSGTAAKLGRVTAYHHCTLLVSVNKQQLGLALKGDKNIMSKATSSIPSPVANLKDHYPELTVENLLASIGKQYLEKNISKGSYISSKDCYRQSDGFTLINPTEDWFPGVDSHVSQLKSWDWLFGMTPKFSITRPIYLFEDSHLKEESNTVNITIESYHGIIDKIELGKEGSISQERFKEEVESAFVGLPYSNDTFSDIERKLSI